MSLLIRQVLLTTSSLIFQITFYILFVFGLVSISFAEFKEMNEFRTHVR